MNKDYYELKKDCPRRQVTKGNLIARLNKLIEANESCQVKIEPYDKRSQNALAAYWMLIDVIVKWDSTENGLNKRYFHDMFMEEAGLVEEVDKMPGWEMKYKNEIEQGYSIKDDDFGDDSYILVRPNQKEEDKAIFLDCRYKSKTRSISNKGDVTKEEMERLIFSILDFGKPGNNNIPGCEIRKDDLSRLLKFCEGKNE